MSGGNGTVKHVVVVVLVECFPNQVLVEGVSGGNGTVNHVVVAVVLECFPNQVLVEGVSGGNGTVNYVVEAMVVECFPNQVLVEGVSGGNGTVNHVVVAVVVECFPNQVLVEGVSSGNGTVKQYQRSRQFKLRAVVYSACGESSLLVKTTTEWKAVPTTHAGATITFSTTSKELVVPKNTLQYGTYKIKTVVVSLSQHN